MRQARTRWAWSMRSSASLRDRERDLAGSGARSSASATPRAANGAYRIQVVDLPADADAQREQLVRRLAAGDSSIDVIAWT